MLFSIVSKLNIHFVQLTHNNEKTTVLFFSSGYDHVLLTQYLVPYLYETGCRPKLERRGNRVTTISTKQGIFFRDVAKLLAPSTNLRKFGQLFGLEQSKAHFPFRILTSVEVLKEPRLPTDLSAWKSDLSGQSVSSKDLNDMRLEAETLFEAAGCTNVGDYLRAYLKLDVVILYKATQGWRKQLKTLIGLDFVECGKYTISSLSYTAGQKNLEANCRVGSFFPNNSQMYRILRRGMRG